MRVFGYSQEKNLILQQARGIGFEDILEAITAGGLVDEIDHPNQEKYPCQKQYAYAVPFVENGTESFLKTIYPSRKLTKKYIKEAK